MCTQKEKKIIQHLNKVLICAAGIAGALVDGFHSGDVLCIASMTIWLWQTEWSVMEEKLVDQFKRIATNK